MFGLRRQPREGARRLSPASRNFLMTMELERGNFLFNIITNNLSGLFTS